MKTRQLFNRLLSIIKIFQDVLIKQPYYDKLLQEQEDALLELLLILEFIIGVK
jgi:hypothetical protein